MAKKKTTRKKIPAEKKPNIKTANTRKGAARKGKATRKQNGLGRPSLFTEERREIIYAVMHDCPFIGPAAKAAGISRRSVDKWLSQGLHDAENSLTTQYAEFYQRVSDLKSTAEVALFQTVKTAGSKDWNAAKYVLSCMEPKTYGQKSAIKVSDGKDPDDDFDGENFHLKLAKIISENEGE